MAANKDLLNMVLSESRLEEKHNLSQKVFHDEPILMTASQMANYTPPVYRKMRDIAHKSYNEPENAVFYKQAVFMEDYEDDYDYNGEFMRYFPTYRAMTDAQLRGYFTWRTKVRRGDIQKTSLSFAYIYIYELINGIGCEDAQDGFQKLYHFWKSYMELDTNIGVYMKRWLKDYCIYYDIPPSYLDDTIDDAGDNITLTLLQCEKALDEDIFEAMLQLSDYRISGSRFYVQNQKDCRHVVAEVVRALNAIYLNSGKYSSNERFFGTFTTGKRSLFAGAVFYDHLKRSDYTYSLSELESYKSDKYQWQYRQFVLFTGKAQRAGALLRTIDSRMRSAYGFKYEIKKGNIPPEWECIIDECIENYIIKKRFESAPKIEIDFSVLGAIRTDSLITQKRLLIDQEEQAEQTKKTEPLPVETPIDVNENKTDLTDLQFRFLLCLLHGNAFADLLREHNTLVSIVSDEINEALFDQFGDMIIVFDDETPQVLDDYIDDLKGYLGL